MQEDGTWCSVCPLAFFDGLCKTAILIEGAVTKRIHTDTRKHLWGDDTFLEFTKCGYNNTETMLKIIAWWVEQVGARLPFVLWLDNAAMHCTMEVIAALRSVGIIVRFFRSHSTHWACLLDNGVFCKWNNSYNAELARVKNAWHLLHGSIIHLPLEETMKAIKFAVEACCSVPNIKTAVKTTTHIYYMDNGKECVKVDRTYAATKMSGGVTAADKTSQRTLKNMEYKIANEKCIAAFKTHAAVAPFFDNHKNCTKCQHILCSDLEIRCIDCLRKKERSKQLLWDGGWGASLTEQLAYFTEKAAEETAATEKASLIATTANTLRDIMVDTDMADTDKQTKIKQQLEKQDGKVFHELTCRRGKDKDGVNITCRCTYGRAREMRDELTKKISATAKAAAAADKQAKLAAATAEKQAKAAATAAAKGTKATATAARQARKEKAAAEEPEKRAELIAKISKICDTKQGNNREKALDAALKSYAHYIKKMA